MKYLSTCILDAKQPQSSPAVVICHLFSGPWHTWKWAVAEKIHKLMEEEDGMGSDKIHKLKEVEDSTSSDIAAQQNINK